MADVMTFEDLEKVYDLLADAIDRAGPEEEALLLSKLALTLAHNMPDLAVVEEAIRIAQLDLVREAGGRVR
jgi:hypothetical protein